MPIPSLPDARFHSSRAIVAALVAVLLAVFQCFAQTPEAAPPGPRLIVNIVEGEGAINNVRQRTAREPIVEVQDENHRPVAGAVVVFTVLPSNGGAGATFVGGSQTAEFVTNSAGRVTASGFHPNNQPGQVQIRVTATSNGRVGSATINQTNVLGGHAATKASSLGVAKILLLVALAAGGAAGGAYAATHGGSHSGSTATSITPGVPVVGAP